MLPTTAANVEKLAALEGMTGSAWLDHAITGYVETCMRNLITTNAAEVNTRAPETMANGLLSWDCPVCNEAGSVLEVAPGLWVCRGNPYCGRRGILFDRENVTPAMTYSVLPRRKKQD